MDKVLRELVARKALRTYGQAFVNADFAYAMGEISAVELLAKHHDLFKMARKLLTPEEIKWAGDESELAKLRENPYVSIG